MTKYEWVKSLSIEEMAKFFSDDLSCSVCSRRNLEEGCDGIEDCTTYIKEWLESEAP